MRSPWLMDVLGRTPTDLYGLITDWLGIGLLGIRLLWTGTGQLASLRVRTSPSCILQGNLTGLRTSHAARLLPVLLPPLARLVGPLPLPLPRRHWFRCRRSLAFGRLQCLDQRLLECRLWAAILPALSKRVGQPVPGTKNFRLGRVKVQLIGPIDASVPSVDGRARYCNNALCQTNFTVHPTLLHC